jgi:FkbH-like protein
MLRLTWLPKNPDWRGDLVALDNSDSPWSSLRALANSEIDFVETARLDRRLSKLPLHGRPDPVRLGLLSSCTVDQVLPGLRVAALRRNIALDVHMPDYGQFRQALLDPDSSLAAFRPHVVLFAIDARSFVGTDFIVNPEAADDHLSARLNDLVALWRIAREKFGAQVIQQTFLPTFPYLMGGAEHRAPGSPAAMINSANASLRTLSVSENVDLLALEDRVQRDGIDAWHSTALWNRAKQDVFPAAAPMYGELAVRIIAARRGHSAKCLVLDLDNTIWGGVIGDDGLDGILLGEGNAEGEAFLEFQRFAKSLSRRGVILAVCSKNDESNAMEAFEKHPEMILRREDIAAFCVNWDDKATNLRRIAADLNIGLDALVFADDNPFERNIVRRELPEVHVPELPEDAGLFSATIADAGYFEALEITHEDLGRAASYQAMRTLRQDELTTTDLEGYLASLDMKLLWGVFGTVSLKRVTQLVNKTNQFNLTTRRYTEAEISEIMSNSDYIGLHLRLVDRYADHGIIGVLIGRRNSDGVLEMDSWLMSCRVLGRGVEKAALSILVDEARRLDVRTIVGRYHPSPKNGMVRDLYPSLGFRAFAGKNDGNESSVWELDLSTTSILVPNIVIKEIKGG